MTHNRVDFEKLAGAYVTAGRHHSGIRIATRRSASEIARRVLSLLNSLPADELDDRLLYL